MDGIVCYPSTLGKNISKMAIVLFVITYLKIYMKITINT